MLFSYRVSTTAGEEQAGSIESPTVDLAISSLQRRGLIVIDIQSVNQPRGLRRLPIFNRVKQSDVVILSRQIATLFEAKVSVVSTFTLLSTESENPVLRAKLIELTDDIKGGISISDAMNKHPEIFSDFYISMIRSGEESGKLSEAFNYLADYLERTYELYSKARNALVYPAFVVASFIVVMSIMVIFVIPKLGVILEETGQELPIYTKAVLGVSNFFANYWFVVFGLAAVLAVFLTRYLPTQAGKESFSRFKLSIPYVGDLYHKLYLSRIADNLNTMIVSGVSMVRALEITSEVVDNEVYRQILKKTSEAIKGGAAISDVFSNYPEIPGVMVQMMKVGEESGKLAHVLETMARFYRREVNNSVDTLVGLIEPFMIVILGLGVGVLLTAVLVPIYNVASAL